MEEDTVVNLGFDKALLYKNMVAADADWLYELEEWNDIFDEETRKKLYKRAEEFYHHRKGSKRFIPMIPVPAAAARSTKKVLRQNK